MKVKIHKVKPANTDNETIIENKVKNLSEVASCDRFICSNCKIELKDWAKVEYYTYEDGYKEECYVQYAFKYCPNCGKAIEEE